MPTTSNAILRKAAIEWAYRVSTIDGGAPIARSWAESLPADFKCPECNRINHRNPPHDVYLARPSKQAVDFGWMLGVWIVHVTLAPLFERVFENAVFGRVFVRDRATLPILNGFEPAAFRVDDDYRCLRPRGADAVRVFGVAEDNRTNRPDNCSKCGGIRGVISEKEAFVLERDWEGRSVAFGNGSFPYFSESAFRSIDWREAPRAAVHAVPVISQWDVPVEMQVRLWGEVVPPADAGVRRHIARAKLVRRDSQLVRIRQSDLDDDMRISKARPAGDWFKRHADLVMCRSCRRQALHLPRDVTVHVSSINAMGGEPYVELAGSKVLVVHEALAQHAAAVDHNIELLPIVTGKGRESSSYRLINGATLADIQSELENTKPCGHCGRRSTASANGRLFVPWESTGSSRVLVDGDGHLCFRVEEWDQIFGSLPRDLRDQIEPEFIDIELTS